MSKLLLLLCFLISFSCNNNNNNSSGSKETVEQIEKAGPEKHLTVTGHDRRNLIGQTVVKGTVTNKATKVSYKDVEVKLEFYSKTGTLLETDKEVVYEVLAPGESKNFKTKYFAPKGTDSVALSVTTAKVVEK